jgi:hypothetical protein
MEPKTWISGHPIRLSFLIELQPSPKLLRNCRLPGFRREGNARLRRTDRGIESTSRRVGCGKRVKRRDILVTRDFNRPFSQRHRLDYVAKRIVPGSRPNPCEA